MWTLSGFADEITADLQIQCQTLNGLGIDFIEFRSAWNTNVLDLDDDRLEEAGRILASYGIRLSSVGSPIGKIAIGDDFEPHLVRFQRALHVANVLDAPYIRLFSFFIPSGEEPGRHRDEVLRRMAALETQRRAMAWCCCTRTRRTSTAMTRNAAWTSSSPSVRPSCVWPGIPPTSSSAGWRPSQMATRCCGRTWTTSRSRCGDGHRAGRSRRRGGRRAV